jgi:putative transcriptional regulator
MSQPNHHPDEELLMEYVGGGLDESVALVVATHLALCPLCRRAAAEMEMVGGAILEEMEPEPLSADCLGTLLARLDEPEPPRSPRRPVEPPAVHPCLPQPLRGYIGPSLERLAWKPLLPGLTIADVPISRPSGKPLAAQPRLLKMRGHSKVPRHTHDGIELALVLDGGFRDDLGTFLRGDLAVGDPSVRHTPVADEEGCLCLSLTLGSLKLTGAVGWLLHRLGKF